MSLSDTWRNTSPVIRWSLVAGVVVLGGYFALTPLWNKAESLKRRGDSLESALRKRADFATEKSIDGAVITGTLEKLGSPNMPGKLKAEAFARVVDGVLSRNQVVGSVTERKVRLATEATATLGMGTIDRLILEVTFEATPDTVVAILAELEKAPEVAAVSRVRIDKSVARDEGSQTVRATITPEAWVLAADSSARSSEVSP